MTGNAVQALLPMLWLVIGCLGVTLAIAVRRHHDLAAGIAGAALLAAMASLPIASRLAPWESPSSLVVVDGYTLALTGLMSAAALAVCAFARGYLTRLSGHREEFYVFVLLATVGATVLVASRHFASFFLGLELLSVSLYVLIGYLRERATSLEAALKYVILAAVSSASLLFGMALIYAQTGGLEWTAVATGLASEIPNRAWLLSGLALLLTGVAFKLSLVPFHMWAPDVYQGAPAPVAAFVATVSKGAVFGLLLRYYMDLGAPQRESLAAVLSAMAIASMMAGNLLALLQTSVKRILAYSSIAHLGYLLVALLAGGAMAVPASGYYLTAYFITMLGAFGVISVMSRPGAEADTLASYQGLFWRSPGLAFVFAAMLLSLAGIPLTAGFIGKLYVLTAGVQAARWLLVTTLVVGSVIGLFYYLRILITLFTRPERAQELPKDGLPRGGCAALATLTVLLFWIGVFPGPVVKLFLDVLG